MEDSCVSTEYSFYSHTSHGEEECVTYLVYLVTHRSKEAHLKVCMIVFVLNNMLICYEIKDGKFCLVSDVCSDAAYPSDCYKQNLKISFSTFFAQC